jgi:hypothetical protein
VAEAQAGRACGGGRRSHEGGGAWLAGDPAGGSGNAASCACPGERAARRLSCPARTGISGAGGERAFCPRRAGCWGTGARVPAVRCSVPRPPPCLPDSLPELGAVRSAAPFLPVPRRPDRVGHFGCPAGSGTEEGVA